MDYIRQGSAVFRLACPRCGLVVELAGEISAVLTVPSDESPSIKPKVKATRVMHRCDQLSITDVDDPDGEWTGFGPAYGRATADPPVRPNRAGGCVLPTCDVCGAPLVGPVAAVLHYERVNGRPSPCERHRGVS